MSTIHALPPTISTEEALAVIDDLRAKVESGQVIAFAAVGIEPGDETMSWQASVRPVTRLRMMGAIWNLLQCF
jgi:hypothetical protein